MDAGTSSVAGGDAQVGVCDSMIDIGVQDLTPGLTFPSEESAVKSIDNWAYKTLCPLVKVITIIQ